MAEVLARAIQQSSYPLWGEFGFNWYQIEIASQEYGSLGRARTADPVINSHLLYLLSYQGIGGQSNQGWA